MITLKETEMLHTIRERVRIKVGGVVEIRCPELPEGSEAEVTVVVEDAPRKRGALRLPAHDVGPWPSDFPARREELYGDDGR